MLQSFQPRFEFLAHALNAEGGFYEGRYIRQYPRETEKNYAARQSVAWYRNHLRSACADFVGYLTKRTPLRDTAQPLLQGIIDDADMRGNSLDVFFAQFMLNAKARGSMLLLVDMPNELPNNRAAQVEQRAFPYLEMIEPERIIKHELNKRGLLNSIEIYETWPNTYKTSRIRGWDTEKWWIKDGEHQQTEIHGLGLCPVLVFTEAGTFPHVGTFAQIADLSKRYYNAASERDEILRGQTFSVLTYHFPDTYQPQRDELGHEIEPIQIGVNNVLKYFGERPGFIAPPDGPATILSNVMAEIEESIRRIAMTVDQPTGVESGLAKALRFQQLNSALTQFAQAMEDFERRIWWVASRWLGLTGETVEVQWAKDYSLADIESELAELQQMQSAAFPEAVIKAKKKIITSLAFPNLEQDELQALLDEIDAEVAPPPEPAPLRIAA